MRNGLLIAPIFFALVGCTTYINIPAQPGDVAVHDPNDTTLIKVEAAALAGVLNGSPIGPVAIALPEGTNDESYQLVLKSLAGATRASQNSGAMVAHVRQVRVRGRNAEVDIVIPVITGATVSGPGQTQPPPPLQLVTSYLNWEPIAGWQSVRLRYWRIPVDDALLKSRTQVEPAKEEAAPEPAPEPQKPGNN